jgi:RNA polymerase sigma factor (sigma-70 family)
VSFPPTRLSVVAGIRSADEETRTLAFASLVEAYWKPVYKYLRLKWHLPPEEAADLTQDFFAHALETNVLGRYEASRARFRTYLRLCLDGYASNVRKAERRLKRGGAVTLVPLDFTSAEGEIGRHEPQVLPDVEELFYREWARALFQRAIEALRQEAAASGRDVMFDVFRRYDLAETPDERPTYAAIGAVLGLPATTVTNHLAAMRRRLRKLVLDQLRELTMSDEEYEAEARRLLGNV